MLEDKLRSTDWEATYDAIEEAVARDNHTHNSVHPEDRPVYTHPYICTLQTRACSVGRTVQCS